MKTGALALAIGLGLLGVTSTKASAQVVVAVPAPYVAVPPAYVEIGPPPGPGYLWVPAYHRWEYRPFRRGWVERPRVYVERRHWR